MKNTKIEAEVTAEDIAFGEMSNPQSCPIARAVKRAIMADFVGDVIVSNSKIRLTDEDETYIFDLDSASISFIFKFDLGRDVLPCKISASFYQSYPNGYLEEEAHDECY